MLAIEWLSIENALMSEIGKYIVLEGSDNVGKTTQVRRLATDIGAFAVREPGDTNLGDHVRGLLLDPTISKMPKTEVLLHAAQRAELMETVIIPTINKGQNVISDRSWISSAVYQQAQGESLENIYAINKYALGKFIVADLTIVLDADPSAIGPRRTGQPDYYERMNSDFHNAVRSNYLDLAQKEGWQVINAEPTEDIVATEIRSIVKQILDI